MKIISILIIFIFYNSMIDSLLDALFFFSSRRRHTRFSRDWSSDVCSSDLKEEFDGPPERALAELADALLAKGVKQISGDVIGDDSYFPREPYPNGWEIDDMVWEYGAAVSAIAVNDNTVALMLTPGALAGDGVQASVVPATPDFIVSNRVVTSAPDVKSDLTLTR